jgi:hypothetical protein|tara:strand:+ start:236 stop:355 length:120 start_codon:yes stop_codon:yes gene_type:complete
MKVNVQKEDKNIKKVFIKPENKEDQKMLKEWVKLLKKIK